MDIVRFWKDPEYRSSLSENELRVLPEHPCGPVELTDEVLVGVLGARTEQLGSAGCCAGTSSDTNCPGHNTCCKMTEVCYTCSGPACK